MATSPSGSRDSSRVPPFVSSTQSTQRPSQDAPQVPVVSDAADVERERVKAARQLIRPQPNPKRRANRIVFEPDDTPADAEDRLKQAVPITHRKRPGPVPMTASQADRASDAHVRAMRAAISAYSSDATNPPASPELSDAEMEQMIALVQNKYGPLLNIEQASEFSKLAKQTIRERVCKGVYADCVIRGRPLRFVTHRFVKAVMTQ